MQPLWSQALAPLLSLLKPVLASPDPLYAATSTPDKCLFAVNGLREDPRLGVECASCRARRLISREHPAAPGSRIGTHGDPTTCSGETARELRGRRRHEALI